VAQHTLRSGCIAVAAACALATGALPLTATPASADSPSETVIPAALLNNPPKDNVVFAGTGGFLHQSDTQSTFVWTKYAGGPDIPVPQVTGNMAPGYWGAGSDVVATPSADGYQLHDMDADTTTTITPGAGQTYLGTFGSRVLTVTKAADGTVTGFHVLGTKGGQQTDIPVTGWPAGATPQTPVLAGDADSVVLRYTDSTNGTTENRLALVDLATGTVTPVMGPLAPSPTSCCLRSTSPGTRRTAPTVRYRRGRSTSCPAPTPAERRPPFRSRRRRWAAGTPATCAPWASRATPC
jgi:hypothetical protein